MAFLNLISRRRRKGALRGSTERFDPRVFGVGKRRFSDSLFSFNFSKGEENVFKFLSISLSFIGAGANFSHKLRDGRLDLRALARTKRKLREINRGE